MLISILDEDGGTVYFKIEADGKVLEIIAEVAVDGRVLQLNRLDALGDGANSLGYAVLRRMVHQVMEDLDVDAIVVGGARRTSGAGPGRTPRKLRFTRKVPS